MMNGSDNFSVKVGLSFPINTFWWRKLYWGLKKKQNNLGLPTFKLPTST